MMRNHIRTMHTKIPKFKRKSFIRILAGAGTCSILHINTAFGLSRRPKEIRIAHLADPHIGLGKAAANSVFLKTAVDRLNSIGIDIVLVCGDLLHMRKLNQAALVRATLSRLKARHYVVPGNHDVGMIPSLSTLKAYRHIVGPDYYSFRIGRWEFIGINSQLWVGGPPEERQRHDKWLADNLLTASKRSRGIIVFGHMPLFTKDPREEHVTNENIEPEIRQTLLSQFNSNGLTAYLCGHLHRHTAYAIGRTHFISAETTSIWPMGPQKMQGFKVCQTGLDPVSVQWKSHLLIKDKKTIQSEQMEIGNDGI